MKPLILTLLATACIFPAEPVSAEPSILLHCVTTMERDGEKSPMSINIFISPDGSKFSMYGDNYTHREKVELEYLWVYQDDFVKDGEKHSIFTAFNPRSLEFRQQYFANDARVYVQTGYCMPIKTPFKLFNMLPEE